MKLQIEKFLALTAMIATAQVGTSACTTDDGADDTEQEVDEDDDAGAQNGSADDDGDDDTATDDDGEGDDDALPDAGAEGGDSDDDVDADDDAANEGGDLDAGVEPIDDAGAEGGEWLDAGMAGDAGSEGGYVGDAGGEGEVFGDAGLEGGGDLCPDGSFDPALEATECAQMFDSCGEDYYGTGAAQCWEMADHRTAAVYEAFIACVTDAEITDPCGEEGDSVVSVCAYEADYGACAVEDPSCEAMANDCPEIDAASCNAALAKYPSGDRYTVTSCFDYYYQMNMESYGPGYEGCGFDYQSCLAIIGPGGE